MPSLLPFLFLFTNRSGFVYLHKLLEYFNQGGNGLSLAKLDKDCNSLLYSLAKKKEKGSDKKEKEEKKDKEKDKSKSKDKEKDKSDKGKDKSKDKGSKISKDSGKGSKIKKDKGGKEVDLRRSTSSAKTSTPSS